MIYASYMFIINSLNFTRPIYTLEKLDWFDEFLVSKLFNYTFCSLFFCSTLCDPYLNIFRGVIPPLGGTLDLSPILAFLVLNALTSTASALPAELPSTESSQKGLLSQRGSLFHTSISHLTSSQEKWMKRFNTQRSKGPGIDEWIMDRLSSHSMYGTTI